MKNKKISKKVLTIFDNDHIITEQVTQEQLPKIKRYEKEY